MKTLLIFVAGLLLAGCSTEQMFPDVARASRMMKYGTPAEQEAARAYLWAKGAESQARLDAMNAMPRPVYGSTYDPSWDALQTQIAIDGQTRAIREAAAMQADAINNAALMQHYGH